jgi:ATP-dependent helicase/nuclease subunit B
MPRSCRACSPGTPGRQHGPPVIFAGFDTLSPAQCTRLSRARDARARRAAGPRLGAVPALHAFADGRQEFAAAAAWARSRLEADPAARLGIVVPDLDAAAPYVEDLLDEALCPERLLPGRTDAPRPWNVSLGVALADAPAVAAALVAGTLARDALEAAEVGRLLRSPYFAGAEEEGAERARLDAWLREHAGDRVAAAQLLRWLAGRDGAPRCPRLEAGVRGLLDELHASPRRRRPSDWAAALTRGLRRLGWPGGGAVDSATWQVAEAWAGLLEAFSRLDAVIGPQSLGEALARLKRMGAQQRFQPETPELPIQVLGLLETAGLEFDGLWVTGMHDGVLPAPLRPCALLPAALQRERGMPRACPDTELALARRLVARLAGAAGEVRFSYPASREDEPLRPSPVLAALPPAEPPRGRRCRDSPPPASGCASVEEVERRCGAGHHGAVAGGTGLLAAQAACPFRAFALAPARRPGARDTGGRRRWAHARVPAAPGAAGFLGRAPRS